MAHTFRFTVTTSLERQSGKFAGRDELADELRDAIEGADPSEVYGVGADGDSTYEVTGWEVEDAD